MEPSANSLRSVEEVPQPYRSVFREFPCFNVVQSRVFDEAFRTDNSLVVSAPTGSGKTAIFEMAIIRHLIHLKETPDASNDKIVYISPIKALCQERLGDWYKKFINFGVTCISATSDSDEIDVKNVLQYNLIMSTPEKWDVITRKWREDSRLVGSVGLFLIDEVHLLNVGSRGSTLEVIVSRMKTAIECLKLTCGGDSIRFVVLSATIPNIEDIADWIGPSKTTKHFRFSEDVRPVKLNKIVLGYPFNAQSQSIFKFDMSLSYKISSLVTKYSEGKPTLIFCNTRKSVEMTATHLVSALQIHLSTEQKNTLVSISGQLRDAKLKQYVIHGIAIHHAGMVPENRHIIEESFRKGSIPVLVATSTLAMGVNLPAHLVIVKCTKCFSDGGYKDYDEISIFQMIGRAGRSQFDTSATALILTSSQDKQKYEQMLRCQQMIESNLHKHLKEHLNAEVVLRTITDLEVAMRWLSSTFLYVRASRSPEKYKLPRGLDKEKIDKTLLDMCQAELNRLVQAGMIKMNQAIEVSPTVIGKIMAKYYVAFESMRLITEISGTEIMIQLLSMISKCKEFSEIFLRNNDKRCLNLLNKNSSKESIRFPLSGRIRNVEMKVNVIIQAVLGNLEISDQSLLCDSVKIMRCCERLSKCLIEYLETRDNSYPALLDATILAKCLRVKLWENSPYVSKQLTGVGVVLSRLLVKSGLTTFKEITNTNPRHIEMIVHRKAPFGTTLIEEASRLPQYDIDVVKTGDVVEIKVQLLNPRDIEKQSTVDRNSMMILLVGDSKNSILLYEKYTHAYMLECPTVKRVIDLLDPNVEFIKSNFISENCVGIDCSKTLEFTGVKVSSFPQEKDKQNKKQTFLDMYMCAVKKAVTNKKKLESKQSKKAELSVQKNGCKGIRATENNATLEANLPFYGVGGNEILEEHNQEISAPTSNNLALVSDQKADWQTSLSIDSTANNNLARSSMSKPKVFKFATAKTNRLEHTGDSLLTKAHVFEKPGKESTMAKQEYAENFTTANDPSFQVNKSTKVNNDNCVNGRSSSSRCGSIEEDEIQFSKSQLDEIDEILKNVHSISSPTDTTKEDIAVTDKVEKFAMENPDSTAENVHDFFSPYPKKQKITDDNPSSSDLFGPKSIKWRSPLIIRSPVEKYSPKGTKVGLPLNFNGRNFNQELNSRERFIEKKYCSIPQNNSSSSLSFSKNPNFAMSEMSRSNDVDCNNKSSSKKKTKGQFPLSDQDSEVYISESVRRQDKELDDCVSNTSHDSAGRYYSQLIGSNTKLGKSRVEPEKPVKPTTVAKPDLKIHERALPSPELFTPSEILPRPRIRNEEFALKSPVRGQPSCEMFLENTKTDFSLNCPTDDRYYAHSMPRISHHDAMDRNYAESQGYDINCSYPTLYKPTPRRFSNVNSEASWFGQQYPFRCNSYPYGDRGNIHDFPGPSFSTPMDNFSAYTFPSNHMCCTMKPYYYPHVERREHPSWMSHETPRPYVYHHGTREAPEEPIRDYVPPIEMHSRNYMQNGLPNNLYSDESFNARQPFFSQPFLLRQSSYEKENTHPHYYSSMRHSNFEDTHPYPAIHNKPPGFGRPTRNPSQQPQLSPENIPQVFSHTPKPRMQSFKPKPTCTATSQRTQIDHRSFEERLNNYIEPQEVDYSSAVNRNPSFEQPRASEMNLFQDPRRDHPMEKFMLPKDYKNNYGP